METVILISMELTNNTLPNFVTPLATVHAVVGMEMVMSYNISDDGIRGLSVVPSTVLPSGVSIDPPVGLTDSIGRCSHYCVLVVLG